MLSVNVFCGKVCSPYKNLRAMFGTFSLHAKLSFLLIYTSLCRYLGVLKSTMRNKARLEGSIAESVLAKEAMHFCSTFLDGFQTLSNRLSRNDENDESLGCSTRHASTLFPHPGKPLGKPSSYVLRGLAKVQAHRYALFNCSDVDPYLR